MNLPVLVAVLSVMGACLGAPVFEWVFFTLLASPIFAWLFGRTTGLHLSVLVYLPILIITGTALLLLIHKQKPRLAIPRGWHDDYAPVLVFLCSYSTAFYFCMQWPDFVSIGERLRDYSLLASNINFPVEAREPWLAGENLNYYLYWYRFGEMLAALFHWPTWMVYHSLSAFSISLYLTVIFRIFHKYLGFNWKGALLCAVITAFGSNVDGIINFLNQDQNWWGPSRVVKGAINEFPAWSFLLGDIHPHYLNLPLVPFLICLLFAVATSTKRLDAYIVSALAAGLTGSLWIWNANAWEVPMWGITLLCFLFCAGIETYTRFKLTHSTGFDSTQWRKNFLQTSLPAAVLIIISCVSLYLSSRNIKPLGHPWALVDDPQHPTERTLTAQLFMHWGIPLTLIALSHIFFWKKRRIQAASFALMALSLYVSRYGVCFLSVLLILTAVRAWFDLAEAGKDSQSSWTRVLLHGIGLAGIILILIPEFAYLDDPYGDDVQRMNTIFKLYSAAWFMLHVYAFGSAADSLHYGIEQVKKLATPVIVYAACLSISLSFFGHGISLRKQKSWTVLPKAQGLSSLDQRWPGAGRAIKALEKAPMGVVIEAQEGAYNDSTHVSTLASKESFLGWTNHVDLLTQKYDESRRRQEFISRIYQESSCVERKKALQSEKISYIVVGPLEKQRFPSSASLDFSCMGALIKAGEYAIYIVLQ